MHFLKSIINFHDVRFVLSRVRITSLLLLFFPPFYITYFATTVLNACLLAKCFKIPEQLSPPLLGGRFVSTRAGAEGSEGVPSGHSACGCVGGLLQDHGPGQDVSAYTATLFCKDQDSVPAKLHANSCHISTGTE